MTSGEPTIALPPISLNWVPGSPLIGYERLSDNRYRLTAPSASGPIVFDSMRPTRDFLARSLDILPDPGTVRP